MFKPDKGEINGGSDTNGELGGNSGRNPKPTVIRVGEKEKQLQKHNASNIGIPKTGDTANLKLYSFLLAAPIMILLALFYDRK